MTKLDVLGAVDEIKIGVGYRHKDTKEEIKYFPADLTVLDKIEVIYESWPGWKCSISKCRSFEEFPQAAKNYVFRIQELLKVPIKWIGVGPERQDMVEML